LLRGNVDFEARSFQNVVWMQSLTDENTGLMSAAFEERSVGRGDGDEGATR
jgi:hypothetical protein